MRHRVRGMTATTSTVGIRRIDHVGIIVSDAEVSEQWYVDVLGAEPFLRIGYGEEIECKMKAPFRHVFLMLGEQRIELVENASWRGFARYDDWGLIPHYAFMVTAEGLEYQMQRFREKRVKYAGPIFHPPAPPASVYFCDPDSNHLELTVWEGYPRDQGVVEVVPWNDLQHADRS